jgi:hypothetical protein
MRISKPGIFFASPDTFQFFYVQLKSVSGSYPLHPCGCLPYKETLKSSFLRLSPVILFTFCKFPYYQQKNDQSNPEQLARNKIDIELTQCCWVTQNKNQINLNAGTGIAIREYQTDIGPADYVLFVNKQPVGIIEAKRAEEGVHLTMHEDQTEGYRTAKLKNLNNQQLFFGYESTGELTRFTDFRDPKPRSRPVFTFHRPETLLEY